MKVARLSSYAVLSFGLAVVFSATPAHAGSVVVNPGESIQAAVDAAQPGDKVVVMPGDYTEPVGGNAAVRITKPLKLIAKSNKGPVRILPNTGQANGILVEPDTESDPDIDGIMIKGFTVEGFTNNGIFLRHTNNFKILNNTSINNLENGIWPTLSANGMVKKNVAYGSEDSALWVEASENVRVFKNEFYTSPTGLEITISKNIQVKGNDVHDNTTGIGLYHPNGAGLPSPWPSTELGEWDLSKNNVHDNNFPNSAPPGSMSGALPAGGGVLVLGVDRVHIDKNTITNNDFYGISVIDYCVAVAGGAFDCSTDPPFGGDSAPDFNSYVSNTITGNGTNPDPSHPLKDYAADITYIMFEQGHINCFAKNTYGTLAKALYGPLITTKCD